MLIRNLFMVLFPVSVSIFSFILIVYFAGIGGRSFDPLRIRIDESMTYAFNANVLGFRTGLRFFFPEFATWESPWYVKAETKEDGPHYGLMGVFLSYNRETGIITMRRYNGLQIKIRTNFNPIILHKNNRIEGTVIDGGFLYLGKISDNVKLCKGDKIEIITKTPSLFSDVVAVGNIFLGPNACANEN